MQPPRVSSGCVAVAGAKGSLHVLDAADGSQLWAADLGGATFSSPYALGGVLVAATLGGGVRAFGISDGAPLWAVDLGKRVVADLASDDSAILYLVSLDGELCAPPPAPLPRSSRADAGARRFALQAASGAVLWQLPLGAPSVHYSQVVLRGAAIYVSLDGLLVAVQRGFAPLGGVAWSVLHDAGALALSFLQLVSGSGEGRGGRVGGRGAQVWCG